MDYSPVTIIVTFAPGQTTASLSIPILDDSIVETNELFSALLTTTNPNVTLGTDTATVTIQDNDGEAICILNSMHATHSVYIVP